MFVDSSFARMSVPTRMPGVGQLEIAPIVSIPLSSGTFCTLADIGRTRRLICLSERVDGIEPTFIAWKAIVLPLDDTRVVLLRDDGRPAPLPATPDYWSVRTRRDPRGRAATP